GPGGPAAERVGGEVASILEGALADAEELIGLGVRRARPRHIATEPAVLLVGGLDLLLRLEDGSERAGARLDFGVERRDGQLVGERGVRGERCGAQRGGGRLSAGREL